MNPSLVHATTARPLDQQPCKEVLFCIEPLDAALRLRVMLAGNAEVTVANSSKDEVTQLLAAAGQGDTDARNALFALVYDELRALSLQHLQFERPDHTLQATALAHEAYIRLARPQEKGWANRGHFFAACATAIRRILVEHARARNRLKRGGEHQQMPLTASSLVADEPQFDIIALDDALARLSQLDPQRAKIVELRFFGGMTVHETATFMELSVPTVVRYWRLAKAWLYRELSEQESDGINELQ